MEKKKIDRLFQESFKDFEVAPREEIWQQLEAKLQQKKKRRIIPFWMRLSGIAALLIIGLVVWNPTSKDSSAPSVVFTPESSSPSQPSSPGIPADTSTTVASGGETDPKASQTMEQTGHLRSENDPSSKDAGKTSNASVVNGNHPIASQEKNRNARKLRRVEQISSQTGQGVSDQTLSGLVSTQAPSENDNTKSEIPSGVTTPTEGILDGIANTGLNNIEKQSSSNTTPPETAITLADSAKTGTKSLEELLQEKETGIAATERKVNRWQVAPTIAPIYFSSLSGGSPLDPRLNDNEKRPVPTLSYGVGVSYAVAKKVTLRTGVNRLNLRYETGDVLIAQKNDARMLQQLKPNERGRMIQIDNKPVAAHHTLGRTMAQYEGSVNQSTGYIEVPIEIGYRILDQKFSIDLIGGLSTLFLNQNEVSVSTSGAEMIIGEASNLNNIHLTSNVGIGFRYAFLKNFQANFEPAFKYQINAYSRGANEFRPYFFGLYTGVSYRF